jgi:hypothetical protein
VIEHAEPIPDPDVINQERPEGPTDDEADGSIAGYRWGRAAQEEANKQRNVPLATQRSTAAKRDQRVPLFAPPIAGRPT